MSAELSTRLGETSSFGSHVTGASMLQGTVVAGWLDGGVVAVGGLVGAAHSPLMQSRSPLHCVS
jgi:hypothetical protein